MRRTIVTAAMATLPVAFVALAGLAPRVAEVRFMSSVATRSAFTSKRAAPGSRRI